MTEIVIDLDSPGVRVGAPDRKMGNHGQLTADIYFDNVQVPAENVVGAVGGGLKIALQTLTYGRIGIAASGVGMAQATFDHSVERLKTRQAFGKKSAQFQHWQFKLAERATEIENARNLYLKAALRMDSGESFPEPEAGMAKGTPTRRDSPATVCRSLAAVAALKIGARWLAYRVEDLPRLPDRGRSVRRQRDPETGDRPGHLRQRQHGVRA